MKCSTSTDRFRIGTDYTRWMVPSRKPGFISGHPLAKLNTFLPSFDVCIFKQTKLNVMNSSVIIVIMIMLWEIKHNSQSSTKWSNRVRSCKQLRGILSTAGALWLNQLQVLYISGTYVFLCSIRAIITPYNCSMWCVLMSIFLLSSSPSFKIGWKKRGTDLFSGFNGSIGCYIKQRLYLTRRTMFVFRTILTELTHSIRRL